MSVIIDLLKKINKKEQKIEKAVHPGLLEKEKKKSKNLTLYLILGFLVITIVAGAGVYYFINFEDNENVIVYSQTKSLSEKHLNQPKGKPITKINDTVNPETKNTSSKKKSKKIPLKKTVKKNNLSLKLPKKETKASKKLSPPKTPPPIINKQAKTKHVDITFLLAKANSYLYNGNYQKAISIFEEILKYKKDRDILNNILVLSIRTGKISNIYKLSQKYISLINNDIATNIVVELIKIKRPNEAFKFLKLLREKGKMPYLAYGILYESTGSFNKAKIFYKEAYYKNPYNVKAAYYYARSLDINGNYKQALKIYKMAAKLANDKNLKRIIIDRIKVLEEIIE